MPSSSSLSPPASLPPPSHSHSSSPSPPPPLGSKSISSAKKSLPVPWTHQETLALIQAYQDKWYSLKKGQLKAFQWEEVSLTVAARCGFEEPSKTSTQCRNKIEKLRKRYRSEIQKPNPNSWQYFVLLDQMERGPSPLYALPIVAVAKSSNSNSNFNIGNGSLHLNSANYHNNDNDCHSGGSGDSDNDEDFKSAATNKSKSINNIVKGRVSNAMRGFTSSDRLLRNSMNVVRKQYYDGDDTDTDEDHGDDVEEVGKGMELAAEVRGFTERFIAMESRKMEMMRKTERYKMEMEKKRMEMIVEAQRKIVDSIGGAFAASRKRKMDQET